MRIHELTADESAAVVARNHLGRLACARLDQPYVVPIHYSFDAGPRVVYAFSSLGQKIEWMRGNPKVCFEVEEIVDKNRWTTVVAFGRYEELAREGHSDARARAEQLFQQRGEWWLPAAARVDSGEQSPVVLYRIFLQRLSGRRADRDR